MDEKKKEEVTENSEEVTETAEQTNASEDRISELENKYNEANDKYLRVLAEYDNFRKRTLKEKEGIYQDAYISAVKELLPVIDNIERAVLYAEDEKFKEGINLIITAVHQTLEKMGVCEIETKVFDPNLHNAVMHVEDESCAEGEIVEVFQKGYIMGERVIRYAMVKVAN